MTIKKILAKKGMSTQEKQDPNSAVGNVITGKNNEKKKSQSKIMMKIEEDLCMEVKKWQKKVQNFFEF